LPLPESILLHEEDFLNYSPIKNHSTTKGEYRIMRKKVLVMIMALSMILSAVPGMAFGAEIVAVGDAQFELTADTTVQAGQLAAFEELKGMFSESEVADIKAAYEAKIQTAVQARNPLIDEMISLMLAAGLSGNASKDQVKQAIDKGLQWFFYEEITYLTKTVAKEALVSQDTATAKVALEQAIRLYAGSVGQTAAKRDQDFGTLTQVQLNAVIGKLQEAVEGGDAASYNFYRQYFDKTMIKVFAMATLKYAGKVEESFAAGKLDDAKKQQTEGFFFYMPIYNSMKGGSKAAADAIYNAFAHSDGSKLSRDAVKAQLSKSLSMKINGYVHKVFNVDLAAGNRDKALEHVAEGIAFVAALEVIIKEKNGAEAYAKLETLGSEYVIAVQEDRINDAKGHAIAILKAVAKISGVSFKIGDSSLTVNGSVVTTGEAASYLDNKSNRTLGSARFISEAVGAQVDFEDSTKTVTIKVGDNTVSMTLGSKDVYVNGSKSKVALDQELVIKNGRAYVPVRAFAEALGMKVFWHKGEVVIN
jgi:hypothetical protein